MATDTITLAEQLESAGLDPRQAKGIARAIHDHQTEHLATKADLIELRAEFRAEMRFHRWALALIIALVFVVLGKVW